MYKEWNELQRDQHKQNKKELKPRTTTWD